MPITREFKKAYEELNTEQKKAVDTIEGPVMVIAGPGTGKTQILALRIANILLKTDTSPDSILALTFTESGVFSMRKRLVSIIGNPAYKINIFTFHGFCNEIIKNYPEEFPRIIGATNATEIDQIKIIEEILEKNTFEYLKPYGDIFYYLRPVLGVIRNLKREDISPQEFKSLIKTQEKEFNDIPESERMHIKGAHKGKMKGEFADILKKIEKNKELAELYEAYEKALKTRKLYDYEDMIVEVVRTLKVNNDLLLRLQEKYQYLLADEHQDANGAQNEILELLSNFHNEPNIFIVGDEKQAIFRFQGASLENFLYFRKLYPHATIISLIHNYRSSQSILDAAYGLIQHNKTDDPTLRKELIAQGNSKALTTKIQVYEFTEPSCETEWIVQDCAKKIESGVNPNEIAVIYRDNKDSLPLMRCFEKSGVPFSIQSDQNIFDDEDISKLIIFLRAITDIGNNELLVELLYIDFLNIEPLNVYKLIHCANKNHISFFDAIRSEECLIDAGVDQKERIIDLSKKISSWTTVAKNKSLLEAFEIILHESGFIAHIMSSPESAEKLTKLENIFDELHKIAENNKSSKLIDFISYIDVLKKYNILIKTGAVGNERQSVKLMTAHRSKGLEFDHVYITGVYDGHWGNKRDIKYFHLPIKGFLSHGIDPLEDERRLFYVALTRAKRSISLSTSRSGKNGESLLPSQFISEINPALIEYINTSGIEKELEKNSHSKFIPKKASRSTLQDKKFLREVFLEQGLSVTALNKFLNCPWDYFFNNLLRIPTTRTKHQLYGTAIHDTLKEFFNAYSREEDMIKSDMLNVFEGHLRNKPLTKIDFEESLKKGKEALSGYYDTYKNTWKRSLMTEFTISGIEFNFESEGEKIIFCLRGILDKVELLSNGDVNVVDYKTAKPKSRNAIMGKTKTETGDYFRQLVFYKLLLNNFNDGKYRMISGEIDFIEPDERGNYHREKFEISDEDMRELTEKIEETAKSIYTLDFWEKKCEDEKCEWCKLRKLIT